MSFTIKCNKCGVEQEFNTNDKMSQENISLRPYMRGSYGGDIFDFLSVDCNNPKCNQDIDLYEGKSKK